MAYLDAKQHLIAAGFADEIDWQDTLRTEDLTEAAFLREASWVILSAGMREQTIRKHFGSLAVAFLQWTSGRHVVCDREACRRRALAIFNHVGKIGAILKVAEIIAEEGFERTRKAICAGDLDYLRRFPFVGPVTARHLGKNLGVPVAKNDRHLSRIAHHFRYPSVTALCSDIAAMVHEPIGLVDLVLWRYANTNPRYLSQLSELCKLATRQAEW